MLEALDDPRPDIEITPEFWEGVKDRLQERVERRRRRTGKK
jgi:pyridoxine/pyridoxamine 5'-phosphate oxidase